MIYNFNSKYRMAEATELTQSSESGPLCPLKDIANQPISFRQKDPYFRDRPRQAAESQQYDSGFTNSAIVEELFQKHQSNLSKLSRIRAEQQQFKREREGGREEGTREEGSVQLLQPVQDKSTKASPDQRGEKKQQYPVYGNMIVRSQIWLKEKRRRATERREESMLSDLNQCTFAPVLPARKTSQLYLKARSRSPTPHQTSAKATPSGQPSQGQGESGVRRDISNHQYQSAKNELTRRLFSVRY